MNIVKTNKVLLVGILISFIICFACNSNNTNRDIGNSENANRSISKTENINNAAALDNEEHGKNIQHTDQHADEIEDGDNTVTLLNSLDDLYKILYTFSLPLSSPVECNNTSTKFTEIPTHLIPAFPFLMDGHDTTYLAAAKLPEYRNIKIIIVRVYWLYGAEEINLCTFLNNTIISCREIYSVHETYFEREIGSEGELEHPGDIGMTKMLFSITNNYEISIKKAFYPSPPNWENEHNVFQYMYIISDDGKFVQK